MEIWNFPGREREDPSTDKAFQDLDGEGKERASGHTAGLLVSCPGDSVRGGPGTFTLSSLETFKRSQLLGDSPAGTTRDACRSAPGLFLGSESPLEREAQLST